MTAEPVAASADALPGIRRPVGRPRRHDDDAERELILGAAYAALRDDGADFTVASVLGAAGVSTRSFYRQFETKQALLCAMYRRDAQWAARRLHARLDLAGAPVDAVVAWIDEIFSFTRVAKRAERVAVLGSLAVGQTGVAEAEAAHARALLVAPLRAAIDDGIADGSFTTPDAVGDADLVAAAVLHAAGLALPNRGTTTHDQPGVTAFALRALGAADPRPQPTGQ